MRIDAPQVWALGGDARQQRRARGAVVAARARAPRTHAPLDCRIVCGYQDYELESGWVGPADSPQITSLHFFSVRFQYGFMESQLD